jgi:hypothetical protein
MPPGLRTASRWLRSAGDGASFLQDQMLVAVGAPLQQPWGDWDNTGKCRTIGRASIGKAQVTRSNRYLSCRIDTLTR